MVLWRQEEREYREDMVVSWAEGKQVMILHEKEASGAMG